MTTVIGSGRFAPWGDVHHRGPREVEGFARGPCPPGAVGEDKNEGKMDRAKEKKGNLKDLLS